MAVGFREHGSMTWRNEWRGLRVGVFVSAEGCIWIGGADACCLRCEMG